MTFISLHHTGSNNITLKRVTCGPTHHEETRLVGILYAYCNHHFRHAHTPFSPIYTLYSTR